jgi:hypothetical protein
MNIRNFAESGQEPFLKGVVGDHFLLLDFPKNFTEYFFHQTSSNEGVCDAKFREKNFQATLVYTVDSYRLCTPTRLSTVYTML